MEVMNSQKKGRCTAFDGMRCVASGELQEVAGKVKKLIEQGKAQSILIFDDLSSEPVEVDFRGTVEDVQKRLEYSGGSPESAAEALNSEPETRQGPGRPKLGVVPREVTLLPRHWEWLSRQPGGASVALRKLVEDARKGSGEQDRLRSSQESLYRFMSAMAGDLPGFEEASRAMFALDAERFHEEVGQWPPDIRRHVGTLSAPVFRIAH